MLQKLNFPEYDFSIQNVNDVVMIYDRIRKKFVKLTPEEWVRQHVLYYLLDDCRLPLIRIAVEKQLKVHKTIRRFDVVVFGKSVQPLLLIECKAPTVAIDQSVFEQAIRYNLNLQVPYLWLSNGLANMTIECDQGLRSCHTIGDLPPAEIWK